MLYRDSTIVYFLLLTYFIFHMNRDRFFLFPVFHMVETPPADTYEEIYFENELAAWMYPPRQSAHGTDKVLVYFNGNAGNVSTRIANIRVIQHLLPEYRVYNLEYPGFGLSASLPLSLESLCRECETACESILRRHPSLHTLGMWGESLGALVMSHVFATLSPNVQWVLAMNGVASLPTTLSAYLPPLLHALVLPVLPGHTVYSETRLTKSQKLFLVHAKQDEVVSDSQSKEAYLALKSRFPESVYYLELRGKHNGVLLQKENQDALQEFLDLYL